MRRRLHELRGGLVTALRSSGTSRDFAFIGAQKGMFSFTGLSPAEVARLQKEFSIYIVNSGRINVAGLNTGNLAYVVDAIKTVVG